MGLILVFDVGFLLLKETLLTDVHVFITEVSKSVITIADRDEMYDWCNKGRGMCYPVCGMVHIKEPLLLINKSSLCFLSHYQNGP